MPVWKKRINIDYSGCKYKREKEGSVNLFMDVL